MTVINYVKKGPEGETVYGGILLSDSPEIAKKEMHDAIIESRDAVFTTPDERKIKFNPKVLILWNVSET